MSGNNNGDLARDLQLVDENNGQLNRIHDRDDANEEDIEEGRPMNRQNYSYTPRDAEQVNKGSFNPNLNYREISIAALASDDSSRRRNPGLMRRFIDLQLLRIITGTKEFGASVYNKKIRTRVVDRHFKRLYLLRVVNNPNINTDHSSLVYIMESRTQNISFWSDNSNCRDNGSISIGSFIRVMCPKAIDSYMRNDIPLLESGFSFILLKTPPQLISVSINQGVSANVSCGFVYNRASLEVSMAYPVSTQCSGYLCDCQRIHD